MAAQTAFYRQTDKPRREYSQNSRRGGNVTEFPTRPQPRERVTPQSLESEQSALGAMLMQSSVIPKATALLESSDFYRVPHQKIFAAIVSLFDKKAAIDLTTVVAELRARGDYEEVGGAPYLTACIGQCSSALNIESYAHVVLQKSIARQALRETEIFQAVLSSTDEDVSESLKHYTAKMEALKAREINSRARQEYSTDCDLDTVFDDITWLWPDWIPRGLLTLVVGRPGVGKSTVVMDICKRIILDADWPDGQQAEIEDPFETEEERPMRLLWIDTESGLGIFRQRLHEWEFPRGHFVFAKGNEADALRVDNDRDWAWIVQAVRDHRPPIVVVDSLAAAHSGDENSNDCMKFVMLRLSELAAEFNIAVVCIHHLNKLPAGFPDWPITLDMIRGASAITQYPRSIIGVGTPNKNEPLLHGFMSVKVNFGSARDAIGYQTTDFGPAWGDISEAAPNLKPADRAANWLREELRNGPRLSTDLLDQAQSEKICSRRTLETASKNMGVNRYKEPGAAGRWFWELKEAPRF